MSNGNGHRWSKFWWCDWQNDAALRMCSFGAQGYWMRALCIMHEAEPVGHLTVNGRIPTTRQLSAITGATEKEVAVYTAELEENGVFSRLPDGTIYCRRMVRDAAASEAGRENISKRWSDREPNTPPNRGAKRRPNGEARSRPKSPPDTRSLEAEVREEPPRSPPRGAARRGNSRNAAHDLAREMDATQPIIIDGMAEDVVDFRGFYQERRRAIGGADG